MIQTILDPVLGRVTFDDQAPIHTSDVSYIYDLTVPNTTNKYCIKLYNSSPKIKLSMNAYRKFESSNVKLVRVYSTGTFTMKTDLYTLTADYVIMEKMQNILTYHSSSKIIMEAMKSFVNTLVQLKSLGFMHTRPVIGNIATNDFKEYCIIEADSIDIYNDSKFRRVFEHLMINIQQANRAFLLLSPFISTIEDLQRYFNDPLAFVTGLKTTTEYNKDKLPMYTMYMSGILNTAPQNPTDRLMAQKFVTDFKKAIPNVDLINFIKTCPSYIPLTDKMKSEIQMLWTH